MKYEYEQNIKTRYTINAEVTKQNHKKKKKTKEKRIYLNLSQQFEKGIDQPSAHTHKHKQIRINFEKQKEQTNETSEYNDKVVSSTIT